MSDHSDRPLSVDTPRSCLLVIFLLSDSHLAIRKCNFIFQKKIFLIGGVDTSPNQLATYIYIHTHYVECAIFNIEYVIVYFVYYSTIVILL